MRPGETVKPCVEACLQILLKILAGGTRGRGRREWSNRVIDLTGKAVCGRCGMLANEIIVFSRTFVS